MAHYGILETLKTKEKKKKGKPWIPITEKKKKNCITAVSQSQHYM